MAVYCDLNICEAHSYTENFSNIKQLLKLGYEVLAINRYHDAPTKEMKQKEKGDAQVKSIESLIEKIKTDLSKCEDKDFILPQKFQILSRVTIPLDNVDQCGFLRNNYFKQILTAFDLIAFTPTSEKVFKVISENKINFDILSLPLEEKFNYKLFPKLMGALIAKEIVFEVYYSPAIKSASLRKYIFHNGKNIVQKTKNAKGVIFSSKGETWIDFRSPQDVINLSNLFEVKGPACIHVISRNNLKVLRHATLRSKSFLGAVMVEKTDSLETCSKKMKLE